MRKSQLIMKNRLSKKTKKLNSPVDKFSKMKKTKKKMNKLRAPNNQ